MVSYKHMSKLAYQITLDKKEPFHYKNMYRIITGEVPFPNPSTDHCENFRNFIHYNDKRFYHLKNGYFTLTQWLGNNRLLFNFDKISHDYNINILSNALIDSGKRLPYILNKYNDEPKIRCEKVFKGKIREKCAYDLFLNKYGENVKKPSNDYCTPDKWDFKVFNLRIDVKSIGFFNNKKVMWIEKNRLNKQMADIFLCVESNGNINLIGYIYLWSKYHFYEVKNQLIFPIENLHDPEFLFLYLNHLKYGFDLKEILKGGKRNV